MRLELSGSLSVVLPVVLTYTADDTFTPADWIFIGYNKFDIICIGAGGGRGGNWDTVNTGTQVKSYGGAGGGGGIHRVQGLLEDLPSSCAIVVGQPGSNGTDRTSNVALTTNGTDGEYSSFQSVVCRASGGKGGKRVSVDSKTVSSDADGGAGGIGDSLTAGGGGAGGNAGTPADPGPGVAGTAGADGSWNGSIGSGGGGGAGGVGKYYGNVLNYATKGGRGAYNPGDLSVYAPGGDPSWDEVIGSENIVPGFSGGAKAAPVNGISEVYGNGATHQIAAAAGLVVVRLTVV